MTSPVTGFCITSAQQVASNTTPPNQCIFRLLLCTRTTVTGDPQFCLCARDSTGDWLTVVAIQPDGSVCESGMPSDGEARASKNCSLSIEVVGGGEREDEDEYFQIGGMYVYVYKYVYAYAYAYVYVYVYVYVCVCVCVYECDAR